MSWNIDFELAIAPSLSNDNREKAMLVKSELFSSSSMGIVDCRVCVGSIILEILVELFFLVAWTWFPSISSACDSRARAT